jgi:CheY-like chemotaxis protein
MEKSQGGDDDDCYDESLAIQLLEDSMGGQRSKIEILAAILHICIESSLKNHIIGKGNLSDAMTNHYLSILMYRGLLEIQHDSNGKARYKTTEKGKRLIYHYNKIQQLLSSFPAVNLQKKEDPFDPTKEQVASSQTHIIQESSLSPTTLTAPLKTKRILIIDDEADISSGIQRGLENAGFFAEVFNDPFQVIAHYKPGSYDLVIMDVKMPKINGFELYRELKKVDDKIKVCFLTAFEMYYEEFKTVFPDMDVKSFIKKPISLQELTDTIRSLTGRDS